MKKLTPAQISKSAARVPDWKVSGKAITRTFQFKDFVEAMKFVKRVAKHAEAAWHHPDIDIRWNKVKLVMTSHDLGGLSEKDFSSAVEYDSLYSSR
ncbi:MAG: 4a-hydroxytetrahydrobiopterin dehydratase [Verrucomicrobia bacterium]|nr:4a-hydroxytetrahydrobiopterin dehydratase [Verrucomicrobiota bacterium]